MLSVNSHKAPFTPNFPIWARVSWWGKPCSHWLDPNVQWRIQDFPMGHQLRGGGAKLLFGIIFVKNCMKMKKKTLTPPHQIHQWCGRRRQIYDVVAIVQCPFSDGPLRATTYGTWLHTCNFRVYLQHGSAFTVALTFGRNTLSVADLHSKILDAPPPTRGSKFFPPWGVGAPTSRKSWIPHWLSISIPSVNQHQCQRQKWNEL